MIIGYKARASNTLQGGARCSRNGGEGEIAPYLSAS
jgi:hypothetical protein